MKDAADNGDPARNAPVAVEWLALECTGTLPEGSSRMHFKSAFPLIDRCLPCG
jgi:hypothetical protein